jgi:hypothetical protein
MIALAGAVLCLLVPVPAVSQSIIPSLGDIQKNVDNFSEKLALSLPFNAAMGLNWADAHIGQFLGLPPHFGVGVSMGFTTIDGGSMGDLLHRFNIDLPIDIGGYPIPGYAVEGRIGGFVLPFDVGLKFGYLPIKPENLELDYFLIGGDVRYALLKETLVLPAISVGMGYNYLNGGLAIKIGEDRSFSYKDISGGDQTLTLSAPKVGLLWETSGLDFKAQISKSFLVITPYLGIGLSHAWSRAGYEVQTTLSGADLDKIKKIMGNYGITDITANGLSSIVEITGWSGRLFGGLSFNLPLFKIDLTGMFNFADARYGVALGLRFQV